MYCPEELFIKDHCRTKVIYPRPLDALCDIAVKI